MGALSREKNDDILLFLLSILFIITNVRFILICFLLLIMLDDDQNVEYPLRLEYQALYTNIGKGRGRIKRRRCHNELVDVYSNWMKNTKMFESVIHINCNLFHVILNDMKSLLNGKEKNFDMSIENMLLLSLIFVITYPTTYQLCIMFGISPSLVSRILDYMFPFLVEYFVQFVPDCPISEACSIVDRKIKFIIDNTIHKIHRPTVSQRLDYNGHYRMHGRQTQILVDFDGNVISYLTNIRGKIHDSLVAIHNKNFVDIVGSCYALGDPGFAGVGYVVSGYKSCEVKSIGQKVFDKITRSEQVRIENINKFIKDCRSVNKQDSFRHGEGKLVACVAISIGLYNFKKMHGYFSTIE